jgi:hypothetical protein
MGQFQHALLIIILWAVHVAIHVVRFKLSLKAIAVVYVKMLFKPLQCVCPSKINSKIIYSNTLIPII